MSPPLKKILKRQDPTRVDEDLIQVSKVTPCDSQDNITSQPHRHETVIQMFRPEKPVEQPKSLSEDDTDNKRKYVQQPRGFIVKSESISRRLTIREPSFEASDPVDDVGDSL